MYMHVWQMNIYMYSIYIIYSYVYTYHELHIIYYAYKGLCNYICIERERGIQCPASNAAIYSILYT